MLCLRVAYLGHGLTYTSFHFSNVSVSGALPDTATKSDTVDVTVSVTNAGRVMGKVVVQVYCGYADSSKLRLLRYARMLCGFSKVALDPGQSRTVHVPVALHSLLRWDPNGLSTDMTGERVRGAYVIDAGKWVVHVGDCSAAGSAIGLPDPTPCTQRNSSFIVPNTIVFNGKY